MRLWSIHPKYLDVKGLGGLWREALLARKIFLGEASAYKNHPQLNRFKETSAPLSAINAYLLHIYRESCSRGYCFDRKRFSDPFRKAKISISKGQIIHEIRHLKKKLKVRSKEKYRQLLKVKKIEPNPLFRIVKGRVASWEQC